MWSPDKDRNEKAQLGDTRPGISGHRSRWFIRAAASFGSSQLALLRQGIERKSTVEDLQDKLQVVAGLGSAAAMTGNVTDSCARKSLRPCLPWTKPKDSVAGFSVTQNTSCKDS